MASLNFNKKALDSWWLILKGLSKEAKIELATRLLNSLKPSKPNGDKDNDDDWKKLYGAWADDEGTAEDMIKFLRDSRFTNRKIEPFD